MKVFFLNQHYDNHICLSIFKKFSQVSVVAHGPLALLVFYLSWNKIFRRPTESTEVCCKFLIPGKNENYWSRGILRFGCLKAETTIHATIQAVGANLRLKHPFMQPFLGNGDVKYSRTERRTTLYCIISN